MPIEIAPPNGDRESLGFGKETTFGTAVDPTIWHAFTDFTPKPKNVLIPRTGARARWGQSTPMTGGYQGDASLEVETDSDTFPQLLGFALGAQAIVGSVNTMTLGQLPSFTAELNRIADAVRYIGCMIDSVSISMTAKQGLSAKFNLCYQNEQVVASVVSPTFGTGMPFIFEHPLNIGYINNAVVGDATHVALISWTINLANNLNKDYFSFGRGRFVSSFPQMQRKVSGSFVLGFEDDVAQQLFWGGMSGPALTSVTPIPLRFDCLSTDVFSGVKATGTVTIAGVPATGQTTTVTVNGYPVTINQTTANSVTQEAAAMVAAINSDGRVNQLVSASNVAGVITLTALAVGIAGNDITLASASSGGETATPSGATLSNGAAGTNYELDFIMPACRFSSHEVNNKSNSILEQTVQFESSESSNAANDDLKVLYTSPATVIF